MKTNKYLSWVLLLIGCIILFSSVYTVQEKQNALLLRFGAIVTNSDGTAVVKTPGLHFKLPFIYQARIFDMRLQTLKIEKSRMVTKGKRDLVVDYYIKWRIKDMTRYYTSTQGFSLGAEKLLEQKVNDGLRAEFGKRDISEVVSQERLGVMDILRKQANERATQLGVEVVDVRIKSIDFPPEVSVEVFKNMSAERERVANNYRYGGRYKASIIKAKADADRTVIIATAARDAKRIRGEGDAKAAEIYSKAFEKNPDFYAFYRSLQAYQDVFKNKQDVFVLKPDSHFFKYFNQAGSETK
jgi:membrane protease subunit HflC